MLSVRRRWMARGFAGLFLMVLAPLVMAAPDSAPQEAVACTPVLEVTPKQLAFGDVPVGQISNLDLSIADGEKGAGCTITIESITLDFGDPNFELVGLPSVPVDVTVGSPITFQVRFSPPSPGNFAGQITITSNDGTNPTRTVALSGNGTAKNQTPNCAAGGPYTGTVGQDILFDGSGSSDPDGSIVAYSWDFGDGSGGTEATPSHAYATAGTFTVTLTVTDDQSASSTCEAIATVTEGEPDTITVTAPNGGESFAPGATTPITWNHTGTGVPFVDIELSTDGGTTFAALAVSEPNDGTFDWLVMNVPTIQALVRVKDSADKSPADDSDAAFTINGVQVTRPNGGESFVIGNVEAITWDRFGTDIQNVHIELSTNAGFSFTDIIASTENDGTFDWTVAGTATSEGLVRITDVANELARDLSDGNFNLIEPGGNIPPSCDVGGPYNGTVGVLIQFDGSASSDPDGTIASYAWDFGDGGTGDGATPLHAYLQEGKFPVALTVTDNLGATSTCQGTATVTGKGGNQPPNCDAGGPYTGTVGNLINFNGSASSDPDGTIESYTWNFGDGTIATGVNPVHTYINPGVFEVSLLVTDNLGAHSNCSATAVVTGEGNQAPTCDAGGPYTGAPGVNIQFDGSASSDPDGTVDSYTWNFGDGTIETGATPVHAYLATGIYTVTLLVTDNLGVPSNCSATAVVTGEGNQAPICDANGPYNGTVGVLIQFDASASSDPDGTVDSYAWDFGDGGTGDGATPFHAYLQEGKFPVTVTVTDNLGASSTCMSTATIGPKGGNLPPNCDAGGPYTGDPGVNIQFDGSASSDPDGTVDAYSWDFGDGTIETGATPVHAYVSPGVYTVTLTVTDNLGLPSTCTTTAAVTGGKNIPPNCDAGGPYTGDPGVNIQFDGSASSDPDGTVDAYSWDFGDGTIETGATPVHAYVSPGVYTVTLTVTDNLGLPSTCTTTAAVTGGKNIPPNCDADGPYTGDPGVNIQFDGSASSDPDGTVDAYSWDFGDGTIETGATPVHAYVSPGVYTVTLTVTDNLGLPSTCTTTATVTGGGNLPPNCDVGGPYNGTVGVLIQFDGSASSDPDGTIASYAWDFGDGGTGDGATPLHAYLQEGKFPVALTVTDNLGATSTCQGTATVTGGGGNQSPTCDANGPYTGTAGEEIEFDGTGSEDPDGSIEAYAWDFGDGTISTGATPIHTYISSGTYTVTLTVEDNEGATSECTTTATVAEPGPGIDVAVPPRSFGAVGADVTIPIFLLDDVTGQGILSTEFSITYHPRVLQAEGISFVGTIGQGATYEFDVEHISGGEEIVRVSAAWVQPLEGCEEMAFVLFRVLDREGDESDLDLEITFNEGTPEARDHDGVFFKGVLADVNCSGNISALDASLILQETVGEVRLPSNEFPCFRVETADVSGNNSISAFDASLILRFLLGDIGAFPIEDTLQCGGLARTIAALPGERQLLLAPGAIGADGAYVVEVGLDELQGVFGADLVLEFDPNAVQVLGVESLIKDDQGLLASRIDGQSIRIAAALAKGRGAGSFARIKLAPLPGATLTGSAVHMTSAVLNEGAISVKAGGEASPTVARDVVLAQNKPNPFNPATQITWSQPESGKAELAIVDAAGRKVRTLVRGAYPAGVHAALWDGRDESGRTMAAGVYFYTLDAGGAHLTRKMLLLK